MTTFEQTPPAGMSGEAHPPYRLTQREGGFGELWRTFAVNVILSALTVTIYRFWGLTNIRRLLWSRVRFLGDPLEYTGTGWEVFIGFLKVVFLIILPFVIVVSFLNFYLQAAGWLVLEQIVGVLSSLFFYWLFEFAVFLRFRYRANRTSWRGIRARVGGSAGEYAGLVFVLTLLLFFTGFLAYPFVQATLTRYRMNCLSFGGLTVRCELSSARLYPTFLLCGLALIVATVIFAVVIGPIQILSGGAGGGLLFSLLPLLIAPAALAWYSAKFYRELAASIRIGEENIRVSYDVSGGRLLRYGAGNVAIIVSTLGLLWPLTWVRKIALISENFVIEDALPLERMRQEAYDETRVGEEMAGGFEVI